jgi:hypothetical protein
MFKRKKKANLPIFSVDTIHYSIFKKKKKYVYIYILKNEKTALKSCLWSAPILLAKPARNFLSLENQIYSILLITNWSYSSNNIV